jgi:hypothetical protein
MEKYGERLAAVEELEAAVYRSGIAWAGPARKAAEAKAKAAQAEQRAIAAARECQRILSEIEGRDSEAGKRLWQLHNAGNLDREAIGEGGGNLVKGLLDAETRLRKAREEVASTEQRCSDAHATVGSLYRDVLLALDALRASTSPEVYDSVKRPFSDGARAGPVAIEQACRERLAALGAK